MNPIMTTADFGFAPTTNFAFAAIIRRAAGQLLPLPLSLSLPPRVRARRLKQRRQWQPQQQCHQPPHQHHDGHECRANAFCC